MSFPISSWKKLLWLFFLGSLSCFFTCETVKPVVAHPPPTSGTALADKQYLPDYWYQGKAEINRYELQQNRYRDLHPGEAILIFVSEDFLPDLQVKNESGDLTKSVQVLKLNQITRFTTGIYDYSTMTSVFTPVDRPRLPHTLKVSMSSQDWCGQVYDQLNFKDGQFVSTLHSYFQNEADAVSTLPATLLEDELFNLVRMDAGALPSGRLALVPSLTYLRLMHQPIKAYEADVCLTGYTGADFTGTDLKEYRIDYPELARSLTIVFSNVPPYPIEGWTDTYPSLGDRQARTTVAKRLHTVLDDYWRHNHAADTTRRRALGY